MLDELIGGKIDVSVFDSNYKNDETGAAAMPPAALIKGINTAGQSPAPGAYDAFRGRAAGY
jgi:hypothetical protein